MSTAILLIESDNKRHSVMPMLARVEFQMAVLASMSEINRKNLRAGIAEVIILNALTFRSTGARMVRTIRGFSQLPLLLISDGRTPPGVNASLSPPFTSRKLINRLQNLAPVGAADCIRAGGIEICRNQPTVWVRGNQAALTPRAHALLLQLMLHAGKTISREQLYKRVWQTDYVGDMRSLDVHIRWLREVIEKDPGAPALLETIRGKGYLFAKHET